MTSALAALALLAPSPDGSWTASPLAPAALASRVDATLAGMRNTRLSFEYAFQQGTDNGFMACEAYVLGPGRYWMQVPDFKTKRSQRMMRGRWISDGKRFGKALEPSTVRLGPLARRPLATTRPAAGWFGDFSQTVMMGLAAPTHPFASLVTDARSKGFRIEAQQRQFAFQGKTRRQYRMVLAKGPARYEIVVDGQFMLPTSIVNFVGPKDNTRWSAVAWQHTRKPIDPKILAFVGPRKATTLSPAPRRR